MLRYTRGLRPWSYATFPASAAYYEESIGLSSIDADSKKRDVIMSAPCQS